MTERTLANNCIMQFGCFLVKKEDGVVDGATLADRYNDLFMEAGGYDPRFIYESMMAIRHWVKCGWIDSEWNFDYAMSNHE